MFIQKIFIVSLFFLGSFASCSMSSSNMASDTNFNNFPGIYTSTNDNRLYKIMIIKNPSQNQFLVSGFFVDTEFAYMQALNKIVQIGSQERQQQVCQIMQNRFCRSANDPICKAKDISFAIDIYLNDRVGKHGMFFVKNPSYKNLTGDFHETIKGNFLVSKKQYYVSNLNRHADGALKSIKFSESGYIQLFTSETLVFKKIGQNSQAFKDIITKYLQAKQELYDFAKQSTEFFDSCNL